jgi:Uma2 family endonuclease
MNVALPEIDQPVRLRFERPMTDEELMRFCAANEMVRVERDANGELILMSPSGSGTGRTNSELIYQVAAWAREMNSGATFDSNAGFTLPDGSMRSPDAAWIAWPRWNALSKEEQEGFAPICPEFVIELRSPSDGLSELQAKMRLWLANGAEVAWLVDPSRKTVEVYRAGREVEVVEGGSVVEGDGPVAGFVLELGRVWSLP